MEQEMLDKRKQYIEMLKDGICEVVFTKANGEERAMLATLAAKYLPVLNDVDEKVSWTPAPQPRVENLDIIKVYDYECKSWRSFRVDSVKSFIPTVDINF